MKLVVAVVMHNNQDSKFVGVLGTVLAISGWYHVQWQMGMPGQPPSLL